MEKTICRAKNDKERILAYNIDISIQYINFAAHNYQMNSEKLAVFENLKDTNLSDPTEKIWI